MPFRLSLCLAAALLLVGCTDTRSPEALLAEAERLDDQGDMGPHSEVSDEVIDLLERAAEQGYGPAAWSLAWAYDRRARNHRYVEPAMLREWKQERYEKLSAEWRERAVALLTAEADAGDARAMHLLGIHRYYMADGGEATLAEARTLWKRAADAGNADAAYTLAQSAYFDRDYETARRYYRRAADLGDVDAWGGLAMVTYSELFICPDDVCGDGTAPPAPPADGVVRFVSEVQQAVEAGSQAAIEQKANFLSGIQSAAEGGDADAQGYVAALEAAGLL